MGYQNYTVVDADAHYYEEFGDLSEYIDEDDPWKRKFSRASEIESGEGITAFWPKSTGVRSWWKQREETKTTEDIVEVMEEIGIDKTVLIANQALLFGEVEADDGRPSAYANAYVDFMLDRVADPDQGVYLLIPVPYHDPDAAVELIDRVGDERAVVGACFMTAGAEPPLGNQKYDKIYEATENAGLPAVFHGSGEGLDNLYVSGYSSFIETHTLGFLWANTAQLTSLIIQGTPEKFPDLEFVFQECGLFYIPMMMYRMDSEYLRRAWEAPLLEKRPSEYMKEFYYGTQPLEQPPKQEYFEYVIEMIGGPDRLMYASDYPHHDYDEPSAITEMSFLSSEEIDGILGGNAEEVFGI